MAKINIEMDTKELTMRVMVNGEELTNVSNVNIHRFPKTEFNKEEMHFHATVVEPSDDVTKIMHVMASDETVKIEEKSNASADILNYFSQ